MFDRVTDVTQARHDILLAPFNLDGIRQVDFAFRATKTPDSDGDPPSWVLPSILAKRDSISTKDGFRRVRKGIPDFSFSLLLEFLELEQG